MFPLFRREVPYSHCLTFWRTNIERDVAGELAFHTDARRASFGDSLRSDVRYAARTLRKSIGFSLAVVATLALGIGACTTIFGAVDAVLLRSLPFRDLGRLMAIAAVSKRCPDCDAVTPGEYLALRQHSRAFASLAAYGAWSGTLEGHDEADRIDGATITPGFFSTLGIGPAIGRTFEADSASPALAHEVVLSASLWRTGFGGDPQVIGSTITLSGAPYTVVGVMPPRLAFPAGARLWLARTFTAAEANDFGGHSLRAVGRLALGSGPVAAQREIDATAAALAITHADQVKGWRLVSQPLADALLHQLQEFFAPLVAAALFVLLIVCANVINLLLARTSAREREFAVRRALGASRRRVAQQLLIETVVLALLGAIAGALLAWWSVPILKRSVPVSMTRFVPGWDTLAVSGRALAFAIGLSLVSALFVGLLPALRASPPDLTISLRDGGHGATGMRGGRVRRILVIAEFGLALTLLVSAGLMVQSVHNLLATRTGMQPDHVLTMALELPDTRYIGAAQTARVYASVQSAIVALPGIHRVAAVTTLPLSHDRAFTGFNVTGSPPVPISQAPRAVSEYVTPGYFASLGIPLLGGRDFTGRDDSAGPPVAIVSEKMAKRYWHGTDAIGQDLDLAGTTYRIVGVAADVRDQLESPPAVTIYRAAAQIASRNVTLVIRAACPVQSRACDEESLTASIRRAVTSVDRDIAIADVRTMPAVVAEYVSPWRLLMGLLTIFAALALVLAAVGIYGVMTYTVLQRSHEIGVRIALGADRARVGRMVLRDAAHLIARGALLGVLGALILTRVLPSMLYRVSAVDPAVIGGVATLLAGVALAASWFPARRATSVDPMIALRSE